MVVGEDVKVVVNVADAVDVFVDVAVVVDVIVGVEVRISVGVKEELAVKVGETGRMIIIGVLVGMNGGVGERIAGRGDGHAIGEATTRGIYPPLQAAKRRINTAARVILFIYFLHSI